MEQLQALLFLILIEYAVLSAPLLLALTILAWRRRRRDAAAAEAVAARFREGAAQREQANGDWLARLGGLSGKALVDAAGSLQQRHASVYDRVLDSYLRRRPEGLAEAAAALEALLQGIRELPVAASEPVEVAAADASSGDPGLAAKVKAQQATILKLTAEGEKLRKELADTRHGMDTMLQEYSAMFEGGSQQASRRERNKSQAKQRLTGEAGGEPVVDADFTAGDEPWPEPPAEPAPKPSGTER